MLIGLIYLSALNHSNRRKHNIDKLRDKEYLLKKDLRNNYIDQMVALNVMLENGAITTSEYLKIVDQLALRCNDYGINDSFIALMIKKEGIDINAKSESVLRMANVLNEQGKITSSEFESYIDKALDTLKRR
jgi:hypothetical protein